MAIFLLSSISVFSVAETTQPNASVGAAKLIVNDLAKTQTYYETMFGMRELKRYDYAPEIFEETILGFDEGVRLALFAPNHQAEKPLAKSTFPVVLIYTPEFSAVVSRIEAAGYLINTLDVGENIQVAIGIDPSGNAVEIFSRPGKYAIGGSKLIVDDRHKAEAFYAKIFDAKSGQVFASPQVYNDVKRGWRLVGIISTASRTTSSQKPFSFNRFLYIRV